MLLFIPSQRSQRAQWKQNRQHMLYKMPCRCKMDANAVALVTFSNNLTFFRNPSFYMAENKKIRKKQDFERILDTQFRNIAFSKKKMGLFSKAEAFASAFGGKIVIIILTECNKWHAYSFPTSQTDGKQIWSNVLQNTNISKCITAEEMKEVRFIYL